MKRLPTLRPWLVRWLYGVVLLHLTVGIALPEIAGSPLLETYHRSIESGFWTQTAPSAARAQQIWWMSLFGPTIQALSIWMAALIHLGNRYRSAFAWLALIVGIALWAPQDILASLQAGVLENVLIDAVAVIVMLPPLAVLWLADRNN